MKTFEQCCDEVTKDCNLKKFTSTSLYDYYKTAAELYATEFARQKVKEAIELAQMDKNVSVDGEIINILIYTPKEILEKVGL